ncbi:Uncharacterized protein FKW44_025114 [Caligus rogercresseyi]|uniref:Uncharacterized protein n=1 Tax=Caligus rogercresseyi TaxID=217165 RepID=A0A7T8JTC3_CALRO|nr:Uncharacterized protein FKW44_025114 [Caligus rogercresseyi]
MEHTGDAIYAANNLGINSLGRHVFKVNLNGISTHALFLITDEYKGTLINRGTCQVLRIIPDDFPKQIRREQTVQAVSTPTLEEVKTCSTVWKKGKEHRIPDALSRAPIRDPTPEDLDEEQEICGYVCAVQRATAVAIERDDERSDEALTDPILEEIRTSGNDDNEYRAIRAHLRSEIPRD